MTDGCECKGQVTTKENGDSYCCAPGYEYLESGCSQI